MSNANSISVTSYLFEGQILELEIPTARTYQCGWHFINQILFLTYHLRTPILTLNILEVCHISKHYLFRDISSCMGEINEIEHDDVFNT